MTTQTTDDCELVIEGAYRIIQCQGPPWCQLNDEEQLAAQEAGCPWCKRRYVDGDGGEIVVEAGNA